MVAGDRPAGPRGADDAPAGLGLGSAQFGLAYGLFGPGAPVAPREVREILDLAWRDGVDLIDTAGVYGSAEAVIGAARPPGAAFRIVSKLPAITPADTDLDRMARASVRRSLDRLRVDRLDGLLVHHAPDLLGPAGDSLWAALERLGSEGLIGRPGVSVYDPDTLRRILDRYRPELVQLPLSLFDQRFAADRLLDELAARGVEVHARSVYLQGVLLKDGGALDGRFSALVPTLARLREEARAAGVPVASLLLHYAIHSPGVNRVVIGVDSLAQLRVNLDAYRLAVAGEGVADPGSYAVDDPAIIDPRRWTG